MLLFGVGTVLGSTFDFDPKRESADREDLGFGCAGVADLVATAGFLVAGFDVPNREKACALGGGTAFDSTFGFEPNKGRFGRAFGFDFTVATFFAPREKLDFLGCGAGPGFGAAGLLPKNENGAGAGTFFAGVGEGAGAGACLGVGLLKNDIDGFGAALGAGARGTGFVAAGFGSNIEDRLNVGRGAAFLFDPGVEAFAIGFSSTFGVDAFTAGFFDAKNAGEVGLGAVVWGTFFGAVGFD